VARAAGDDLSLDPPTGAPPHLAQRVGARIREQRTALGLTLVQTARAAAVSVSHLSSIETGANLPSLPILARVAAALELTLNEVLRDVGGGGAIRVEHVDDGAAGDSLLSHDELQLRIAALVAQPGEQGDSPLHPNGAEIFIYVRTGSLEATVDGSATLLHAGDSLDAEEPQQVSWRNVDSSRSVSIWARGPLKES
jgi:transcriptional regulator with XRE-family HTH domain